VLGGTIITFGFFITGGRLIARTSDSLAKRQLIACLTLVVITVSGLLSGAFFLFSFWQDEIFDNQLGSTIRMVVPLLFIYPLGLCLNNIFTGDNKIGKLAVTRVLPRTLYLCAIGLIAWLASVSLTHVLFAHLLAIAGVLVILLASTQPVFSNLGQNFRMLIGETRSFGLPVYTGILANVATNQFSGISIGYFVDNTNVAFFAIAQSISQPLLMLPAAIGTVYFRQFARSKFIPRKVTAVAYAASAAILIMALSLIDFVIVTLYTEEFLPSIWLARWMICGAILQGLGSIYNRFLGAQGEGRALRTAAFAQGFVNIIGYLGLVYLLGAEGAAYTRFASGLVYFIALYLLYRRFLVRRAGAN
jgi:O-antigen/teichoic acid export membrane protein